MMILKRLILQAYKEYPPILLTAQSTESQVIGMDELHKSDNFFWLFELLLYRVGSHVSLEQSP